MSTPKAIARPTAKSIVAYVKKNAHKLKQAELHGHETSETVREADYNGHHIVVRTIYRIHVDGAAVTGHMGVSNDGHVHYHPVPNVNFPSAIDMVKYLIDVFPDDFAGGGAETEPHAGDTHMVSPRRKVGSPTRVQKTGSKRR